MESDDDDVPCLSSNTFAALQEFYQEQDKRENTITCLVNSMNQCKHFDEDWQLSQFWYDENTIDSLVNIASKSVGHDAKIALLSCPTLYKRMKYQLGIDSEITLFEFDRRFATFGDDFVFYDYKSPLSIPREKSNYYDLVIADPPFLSEECLTKTAVTMKFLAKQKMILCTGAIMSNLVQRLLDLKMCAFEPKHRNNLANEFCCYSNYDFDELV